MVDAVAVEAGDLTARLTPWVFEQGEYQAFLDTLQAIVSGLLGLSVLVAMLAMAATFAGGRARA